MLGSGGNTEHGGLIAEGDHPHPLAWITFPVLVEMVICPQGGINLDGKHGCR